MTAKRARGVGTTQQPTRTDTAYETASKTGTDQRLPVTTAKAFLPTATGPRWV